MSIRALLSKADGSDESIDLASWKDREIGRDQLLWVDAEGSDELDEVGRALSLDDRVSQVLRTPADEPQARVYEEAFDVVIRALPEDLDGDPVPLRVIAGEGWVITHHREPLPFVDEHREMIQDQREVGRLAPIELVATILDWHVDTFFRAAEDLERAVDELDDAALRSDRDLVHRVVDLRRRIARVRRVLTPHRDLAAELSRPEFHPGDETGRTDLFAPVGKRLDRASEAIAHVREMLIGTFDVHMTRMAQRTNDTMRVLTLASVIFLPSVVLAGIMGMNFKVGLFDVPSLFWVVIATMVAMAAITLGVARWRGWL